MATGCISLSVYLRMLCDSSQQGTDRMAINICSFVCCVTSRHSGWKRLASSNMPPCTVYRPDDPADRLTFNGTAVTASSDLTSPLTGGNISVTTTTTVTKLVILTGEQESVVLSFCSAVFRCSVC